MDSTNREASSLRTDERALRDEEETYIAAYSRSVYRLAYAYTHNQTDAEDIMQEVFFRFYRKRPVFQDSQHEKAWFLRVTINCCKNLLSSGWFTRTTPLDGTLPSAEPRHTDLLEAVHALPPSYRAVVHLHYFEGYTTGEIGAILHRKPSTVQSQLARARAMLKKILEGDENHE